MMAWTSFTRNAAVGLPILALFLPLPAAAQSAMSGYADTVTALTGDIVARYGGGTGGDTQVFYFDLNSGDALSGESATLAAGARRLYEMYRALGGPRLERHAFVERKDGRIYIGLDGEGGRWVDNGGEALRAFEEQLAEQAQALQKAAPGAAGICRGLGCLLRADYTGEAEVVAIAPRGTSADVQMAPEGLAGPAVLLTSADFHVSAISGTDAGGVATTVTVHNSAALGVHDIYLYSETNAFRPLARYALKVVASSEELTAIASGNTVQVSHPVTTAWYAGGVGGPDDHGDTPATASRLDSSGQGRLERPGDSDLFRIDLTTPANVEIASSGPTDLRADLRGADDALVASDDDGGAGYNFRISASLPAGTYYLRVGHCCSGTGAYALTATVSD
jgi:hypothetical protein